MSEIRGKNILIVGYGREGKSVLGYLEKNYKDVNIAIADKNREALSGLKYKTFSENSYLSDIEGFDTVIKSPGIPPDEIFSKAKHLTTLTNIFFEACPGTVIGITGTKGKSTTSSLIAHILGLLKPDVRLIGNVGKPALDYLENATSSTVFVMELSSYQLMDTHFSPHIAVLLPIYEEHLNYHGNFENYWAAKANITKFQGQNDYFVYFTENEICKKVALRSPAKRIGFNKLNLESKLKGSANYINIAAAFTTVKLLSDDEQKILEAIKSFSPLPHRLESVGVFRGIEFVNDSLATIPEATMHALEALGPGVETLIAGGFDRGINFTALGEVLAKSSLKTLILFPDTGERIKNALVAADPQSNIDIFEVETMEKAVELAYENTASGKICLMSPASTSFNLFRDYEDRGNQFKDLVAQLGK